MVVCNPGIVEGIKHNLENRVCSDSIFRIDCIAFKTLCFCSIKIFNTGNTASCTDPEVIVFILIDFENYVSCNTISGSKMRENLFIFHKEDTAAICSNPENSVGIFINGHYIFSIKVAGFLLVRRNAAVFMNNAETCCSSDIVFTFIRFNCYADLVSGKTVS